MTKPKEQNIRVGTNADEKQQYMDKVRERRAKMLQQFRTGYTGTGSTQTNKGDNDSGSNQVESDDE